MDFIKNNNGQAMIEFIICTPLLIILFYSIIYISEVYLFKEKSVIASRYTAWHVSRGEKNIQSKVSQIFFNQDDVNISISHKGPETRNFIGETISTYFGSIETESIHVKLDYVVSLPFGSIIDLKENVVVSDEHYLKGNSWNGCETEIHDLIDVIMELGKKPFKNVALF